MFVDFDVGHRSILIFQAAFKTAAPFAEERQLPETRVAMPQDASEKMHLQADGISIYRGILATLLRISSAKLRRQDFIRIEQENPVVSERQRVHGPLAFLWPAARIMKLD